MIKIEPSLVKQLRDKTGISMMVCKKALVESNGNLEEALKQLRKKAKFVKTNTNTNSGVVAININGSIGTICEVNTATDFVARNEHFQKLVKEITNASLNVETIQDLLIRKSLDNSTIEDKLITTSNIIGENITIRRVKKCSGNIIGSYIHSKFNDQMGLIGSLVSLEVNTSIAEDLQKILSYADQIAMHITATKPISISENDLPSSLVQKEKELFLEEANKKSTKDSIIENIINGKMQKFFQEVVLLKQNFVLNNDLTIKQLLDNISKQFKIKISIKDFCRMEVGEELA